MPLSPSKIPLPHGPQARFLHAILDLSADTVIATASLHQFQSSFDLAPHLDLSEWALEILAQATPLLLRHDPASSPSVGVIAKVDHLTVHSPLPGSHDLFYLRLHRLSPLDSPLPHFHGIVALDPSFSPVLIETAFKVALAPLPSAA